MLTSIIGLIISSIFAPAISAYVGKHVAKRVTENELKKCEERAAKAEALYQIAVTYLRQVADWATRNGIADKLPDPPQELGIDI